MSPRKSINTYKHVGNMDIKSTSTGNNTRMKIDDAVDHTTNFSQRMPALRVAIVEDLSAMKLRLECLSQQRKKYDVRRELG